MRTGKNFIIFLLTVYVCAATTFASPVNKEAFLQDTKDNYLPKASNLAKSLQNKVKAKVDQWSEPIDPMFYEGNTEEGIVAAMTSDMEANLAELMDCLDLEVIGFCKRHGVITGFKIEYRWPVQTVHTHGFFQNRYLPELFYTAIKAVGYSAFYEAVKEIITPFTVAFGGSIATEFSALHGYSIHGPGVVGNVDVDLEKAKERDRYASGTIGTAAHLEYFIGPTLTQGLWEALSEVYQILKYIKCAPPTQLPIPLTSEDPASIMFSRDPMSYLLLYKEEDLMEDMNLWWQDPTACTKYNMNQTQGNIPYNMYSPNTINPESALNPMLLNQMPTEDLEKYGGMCTKNWGASLPITTIESLHHNDIVHAGKNFEKAIRLGWGKYLSFMRLNNFPKDDDGNFKIDNPDAWKNQSGPAAYSAYYPLHKEKDRLQFTYHDRTPRKCFKVGDPHPKFSNADQLRKDGEHGLYSITHWKHFKCCMGFG
ncbi:MAG: hypothetical protein SGJ02_12340 [bacterium]|nr:hypothetical protein [bacterium]